MIKYKKLTNINLYRFNFLFKNFFSHRQKKTKKKEDTQLKYSEYVFFIIS